MWFLIRVVFWLTIVFSLMPWPRESGPGSPSRPSSSAIWTKARAAIDAAIDKARAKGEKKCSKSPIACLEAATKLGDVPGYDAPEEARPKVKPSRGEAAPRFGSAATP